jgi:uncharacterized protein
LNILLGAPAPTFFHAVGIPQGNPFLLLPVVFVAVLLQAGLAEEIGWRGFALPWLQARYSPLAATVVLAAPWALWHFHPQNWAALFPIAFWYVLSVFSAAVLFTWVYNATAGSLLLVVLLHTASDTADWIIPIGLTSTAATANVSTFALFSLISLAVSLLLIITGRRRFFRGLSTTPAQAGPNASVW